MKDKEIKYVVIIPAIVHSVSLNEDAARYEADKLWEKKRIKTIILMMEKI